MKRVAWKAPMTSWFPTNVTTASQTRRQGLDAQEMPVSQRPGMLRAAKPEPPGELPSGVGDSRPASLPPPAEPAGVLPHGRWRGAVSGGGRRCSVPLPPYCPLPDAYPPFL